MKSKRPIFVFACCAFLMAGTVFPVVIRYKGYSLSGHVLFLALLGWCAWVVERTMSLQAATILEEVQKQSAADQSELCARLEESEQFVQAQRELIAQQAAELAALHMDSAA